MAANPFRDATLGHMLAAVAGRYAHADALIADDRRVSYAALYREGRRFARALLALGIGKDDTLARWLPNRPAWLFAQHGCALIGAVAVALNTRYKARELAYILAQSDATALLLTDHRGPVDYLEILGEVLPGLKSAVPGELEAERSEERRGGQGGSVWEPQ